MSQAGSYRAPHEGLPMSPLEAARDFLANKGYEFARVGTLTNPHNSDSYHVAWAGRRNQHQLIIVREDPAGNYRIYVPIRGDATEQLNSLSAWLAENSE